MREVPKSRVLVQVFMIRDSLFSLAGWCEPYALGEAWKRETYPQPAQDLDVDLFSILVYTLYVVKGRTVTPLLHRIVSG